MRILLLSKRYTRSYSYVATRAAISLRFLPQIHQNSSNFLSQRRLNYCTTVLARTHKHMHTHYCDTLHVHTSTAENPLTVGHIKGRALHSPTRLNTTYMYVLSRACIQLLVFLQPFRCCFYMDILHIWGKSWFIVHIQMHIKRERWNTL